MAENYNPKLPSRLEEANRLVMEQLQALQGDSQASSDAPETPAAPQPPKPDDDRTQVVQPPPPVTPPPPPQPEAQPLPPADAEQQYRVLKGKYDAEVPRLHQQVQQLTSLVETLQMAMRQTGPTPDGKPAAPAAPGKDITTEQLKLWVADDDAWNEWGEDWWRKAYARQQRDMQPLKQQLDEVRQEREQTRREREVARTQNLEGSLDRLLPGWQTQNQDPRFVDWLGATTEPRSGLLYVDLLRKALADGDAARVAQLFSDWPGTAQPAPLPPGTRRAPQVPVSQQVTVRPTAPGGQQTPKSKKIWTRQDFDRESTNITKGRLSPAEANALQAEMAAAVREGRFTE